MVDPMKRMTIPEIRQHPWFQARLPHYLAVPPPDTMQQAKKVFLFTTLLGSPFLWIFISYNFLHLVFHQKLGNWFLSDLQMVFSLFAHVTDKNVFLLVT